MTKKKKEENSWDFDIPSREGFKGSLYLWGTFENVSKEKLERYFEFAYERKFEVLIFYPQHEETLRRMGISTKLPYFKRVDELEFLCSESKHPMPVLIDKWEGKRKKYTPIETSLSFLIEKYNGPHFMMMSDEYAYKFASYSSFEGCIKKAKLLICSPSNFLFHPMLEKYKNRIEFV